MPSRLSLNSSRQLFRPVQLNDCVRLSDLRVRVAGALRCFDAAAADFLAPCDVGPPERMRSQAGEVAALGRGRLLSAADSGIPHRLTLVLVLREDPGFRVVMRQAGDPGAVAFAQGAECQRPPTLCRLGFVDVSPPIALLDPYAALLQIHVLDLEAGHLRDARTGIETGLI